MHRFRLASPLILLAAASVVAWFGCGSGDGQATDGGVNGGDGGDPCVLPLTIGHCVDTATGEPCLDFEAATRQFIPLTQGEVVRPIVGPQGSDMFVLAVRAANVDPGTETDPPKVDLRVFHGADELGGFLSWPIFYPDDSLADTFVAPQLFTVIFDSSSLEGETMEVTGEVQDPRGERFCGEASLVVGTLIPGGPDPH